MSLFVETKPVSVDIAGQAVVLNVFEDLSVGRAIEAKERPEREEDDFFEGGIDLLLTYVESWDQPQPWEDKTLRRLKLESFEALVLAVSDTIAPPVPPKEEEGGPSGN